MSFINSYRYTSGSSFRYLLDEVPGWDISYSHLLCSSSYAGDWGEVESVGYGFDINNFAILPNEASDRDISLFNQVDGSAGQVSSGDPYNATVDDWAEGPLRQAETNLSDSNLPFTFLMVLNYPDSTRTTNKTFFTTGDVNGGNGGIRMSIITDGRIEIRIRRTQTIWERYEARITDDDYHILAWTYDGSLNRSGMNLYLDDMTTPLTPDSTSGTTITNGAYLVRQKYWVNGGGGIQNGLVQEIHFAESVLSTTDLETTKEILEQYYTFP